MEGTNVQNDHVTLLAGTTGTWTAECLARADLIGWDPKVSQNLSSNNAKWYSPSQV